jgi:integrase/recombinase XerD
MIQVEAESWEKLIKQHVDEELPELGARRKYKIRNTLEIFARKINKAPQDVTRTDLESFFDSLKKRGLKAWTIRDYKIFLKRFYRNRKGKKFISWIKINSNIGSSLGPEDLISEKEFLAMLSACGENIRDKALISVLREGDFRPEEFLSLKKRNVIMDKYGALVHIEKGKTGPRPIRLLTSSPILSEWMSHHPLKEDSAPLWPSLSTSGKYLPLKQVGLRRAIKRISRNAGINKRIWPYLFRHTRNTELSLILTEAPFCGFAGWKIGSKMPAQYVHLSGKNVDDAILLAYGIKKDPRQVNLPRPCIRCTFINDPNQDLCVRCGAALSLKAAMEEDRKKDERLKRIDEALSDPRLLDLIEKTLRPD